MAVQDGNDVPPQGNPLRQDTGYSVVMNRVGNGLSILSVDWWS